ncbi:MAG: helix-turn-helix transcriptional regulator [Gammaproteobacteria bacterium]|nr:helix-turn-helix transcriptional regulator [Gammaproteobacteria bacterium]
MLTDTNVDEFISQYGYYESKIKKITASIKRLFDLEYFLYTLVGHNGQIFATGTEVKYLEFYFNKMLYRADPVLIEPKNTQNRISYCHSSMIDSPIRFLAAPFMNELNHDNILLLQETNKLGAHHYLFATNKNKGCIINYYLNHLEALKIFTSYFQNEAIHIINKSIESTPINLYNLPNEFLSKSNFEPKDITQKQQNIFLQKHNLTEINTITPREWDCLKLSLQSMSSKECAKILKISHRTVEFHLENLKNKFKCSNKKELISKASFIYYEKA